MPGDMLAVVAVVIVLVFLLIWMNVLMVRRGRVNAKKARGAENEAVSPPIEKGGETPDSQLVKNTTLSSSAPVPAYSASVQSETMRDREQPRRRDRREPVSDSHETTPYVVTTGTRDNDPGEDNTKSAPADTVGSKQAATETASNVPDAPSRDVEVVPSEFRTRQSQGKKVFERNRLPYFLHGASVPEFDSSDWHEVFIRLSEDTNVMGWVAFHNDTAGASDREYEYGFLEVLRNYKKSVSNLQREVGLSHVVETSVVGDEGKIWFLTGNQDNWFALFVDRKADVHEIAKPFIGRLLSAD